MTVSVFASPNPADEAQLLHAIPAIHFPWAKLLPDLQRAGMSHFLVEFADLSAFSPPPPVEAGHSRDDFGSHVEDNHGHSGHVLYANRVPGLPQETARAAWGVFYTSGIIQIENSLRGQQANIDWVLSAEIAHAIDFFYALGKGMRPALNALMHPGGPDNHPWFGGPYFEQPGESMMAIFGMAYTDFVQPDPRFLHQVGIAAIPRVREILQAPRTDEVPPPPPPPGGEPTLRGATDAEYDAEFRRRYGFFRDVDLDIGFTKSTHRWQGHFG